MKIKESDILSPKEKLVVDMGIYLVENNSTVRKTAKKFGISKSTVHKNLVVSLKKIDYCLYKKTTAVLKKNKSERHLRGGMATKLKYENQKRSKS